MAHLSFLDSQCLQDRFEGHHTFQEEPAIRMDQEEADLLHQEEEEDLLDQVEEAADHHQEDHGVHHQEQGLGRQVAQAGEGESGWHHPLSRPEHRVALLIKHGYGKWPVGQTLRPCPGNREESQLLSPSEGGGRKLLCQFHKPH
jgi:hypothetical protein